MDIMFIFNLNKKKLFLFMILSKIIFLYESFAVNLDQLTDDDKHSIIQAVRNSPIKKNMVLNNVNRDHLQGKNQNQYKSYFFNTFNNNDIINLIEDVCDNYDGNPIINSHRKTMTLVKRFNNNVGMAVYENPNGENAQAPNTTSPAGTYSQMTNLQPLDPSPMVEAFSNRVVLVIGLKNIQQNVIFNPEQATMMTFYPQIP